MIKKIIVFVCLISFSVHASQDKAEALQAATDKYLGFINQISQGSFVEGADKIISSDCTKILNGQLFTENREDFVLDLRSVYENHGAWKIYPADIIISSLSNSVVLRLFIEMEKFGTYTAMVILRFDSNNLIREINEVLSPVKGSYDFKE